MEAALVLVIVVVSLAGVAAMGRLSGAKKPSGGWGASLGIAAVGVLVATFLVNFGLAGCAAVQVCRHLGDGGITLAISPILAFPVYWMVAGLAASYAARQKL